MCIYSYFQGNYDTFEQTMKDKEVFNARLADKIAVKTEKAQAQVAQMTIQAKKTGNDKLLVAAASKQRKLDQGRIGNEKNDKGHRFRLNHDRVGYFETVRGGPQDLCIDLHTPEHWSIPQPLDVQAQTLVSLENLSFSYTSATTPLLRNITFQIHKQERVVLLGANGTGKSTLIQLIIGTCE
jgi:ATP-binding cassette subfamily F protein 3